MHPHHFEVLDHDLAGLTVDCNLFPRSSSVTDLNGKGKLGGEEDASPRECVNSNLGKGGRIELQRKKMMSEPTRIKEGRAQI